LITSDHNDLDTGSLALLDGNVDLGAWGIVQRGETNKGEVPHGEPAGVVVSELTDVSPGLPLLNIKAVVFLAVRGRRKLAAGESEDTLTHTTEFVVGSIDFIKLLFTERLVLTLNENVLAAGQNALWGTLKENPHVVFFR
jgi:hypothetical protein